MAGEMEMKTLLDTLPDILFDKTKIIISILTIIFNFILFFKTNFFGKEKITKDKYSHFKTIRGEYKNDKINGCFAIQQYFDRYLHEDEIDYILKSPDAYRIFSLLKAAWGKYEFKDNKYNSKVTTICCALSYFGFLISYLLLSIQIICLDKILTEVKNPHDFWIILIVNVCINVPLLITCSMSISEIACAKKLVKVTNEKEKKYVKSTCFKKLPFLKCKNAEEDNTE